MPADISGYMRPPVTNVTTTARRRQRPATLLLLGLLLAGPYHQQAPRLAAQTTPVQPADTGLSPAPGQAALPAPLASQAASPAPVDSGSNPAADPAPSPQAPWPGLRWLDARQLVRIISGQPGLLMTQPDGRRRSVWAKTVSMVRRQIPGQDFPGKDGPWYLVHGPFDPSRWDILVNGVIIDPRLFHLVWDGELHNLGLLFTFREELPYDSPVTEANESPWKADFLP